MLPPVAGDGGASIVCVSRRVSVEQSCGSQLSRTLNRWERHTARLHSSTARVQLSNAPSAALCAHLLGNRAWTRVRLGGDEIRGGEAGMDGAREEFVGT